MAKKPLNAEEIAELRSSPYVASVIGNKISFTPEFKRMAYEQINPDATKYSVNVMADKSLTSITAYCVSQRPGLRSKTAGLRSKRPQVIFTIL